MRIRIPWFARIGVKLILSRLPASYALWKKLHLFRHGSMHEPDYAYRIFLQHYLRCQAENGKKSAFIALEMGPGDSLLSAVIGTAVGAGGYLLVDVGDFAEKDLGPYREMAVYLRTRGWKVPDLEQANSLEEILIACNAVYGTQGLASLRQIPSGSVDFAWSHAVLEHIRKKDLRETLKELRRVMKQDGVCSHRVDLTDHLGGALNNLRFPSFWWEEEWMARSGFYTNRLRYPEFVAHFEEAGFSIKSISTRSWEELPTPKSAMAEEYRIMNEEDLLVNGFDVVLGCA